MNGAAEVFVRRRHAGVAGEPGVDKADNEDAAILDRAEAAAC